MVYADEIMDWSAGDAKYIQVVDNKRLSLDGIIKKFDEQCSGYKISEFVFFKNPKRSIRLRVFNREKRELALVYMNPYNGQVLKKDKTIFFFFVVAHLHSSLLAGKIGHWIMFIATIIFMIGCITGLVLWFPKRWNKASKKASFTIKWKAKFKKLNYDLHKVLGFYSLIPALVLAITGTLIFSPSLKEKTIQSFVPDGRSLKSILLKIDTTRVSKDVVPIAYKILENEKDREEINIWNSHLQKLEAYIFTTGKIGLKSVSNAKITVYNRYTGEKINGIKHHIQFEKGKNLIWQLHLGHWFGQLGKFITFLTGFIATSLSITGFLIWWHKRKKKKS